MSYDDHMTLKVIELPPGINSWFIRKVNCFNIQSSHCLFYICNCTRPCNYIWHVFNTDNENSRLRSQMCVTNVNKVLRPPCPFQGFCLDYNTNLYDPYVLISPGANTLPPSIFSNGDGYSRQMSLLLFLANKRFNEHLILIWWTNSRQCRVVHSILTFYLAK